jgi:hypothetical protein
MIGRMLRNILIPISALLISAIAVTAFAAPLPAIQSKAYYYDPVARTALALGVTADLFTQAQALQISDALMGSNPNDTKPVPKALQAKWQEALFIAQALSSVKALPHYFALGYEIESAHETLRSWKDFDLGANHIFNLISGIFSQNTPYAKSTDPANGKPMGEMRDGQNRKWDMKLEWVREGEGTATPSGWETNTPPFFNPDELELFSAFLIKLGNSPFGLKADFTGIHQNFDVTPRGETAEAGLVARTIANFLLIHEQHVPAIFEALEVERYGGYDNIFMRPYIFDHPEFLTLLSTTPADKLTPELIQKWQNDYMGRESEIQIENHFDEGPKKEAAKADALNFRHNWKSRDVRVKWNSNINRILVESRIFDHKPDQPWIAMKGTLLLQAILSRSYELAKQGKVFKLDIPFRNKNETTAAYWERIKKNPKMGMDALIASLELKDKGAIGVISNSDFKTEKNFAAGEKTSFGFEVEFFSPNVVTALSPNNANLMPAWSRSAAAQRIHTMENAGVAFNNQYTDHKYATFSSGFRLDLNKYPYMEIRPHLEESGRLEILSNGREISTIADLAHKANEIKGVIHNGVGNPVEFALSFHF